MGNKKARNEALLAALTKFMTWTEQAPQREHQVKETNVKFAAIERWLTAILSSLESCKYAAPELQGIYLSAIEEAVKAAQKECSL